MDQIVRWNFFIYIIKCSDQMLYVGQTNDIEQRYAEHKAGLVAYTSKKLPLELSFVQVCQDRKTAFVLEQKIKKWSRSKKEALINSDWNNLKLFAKKNFKKLG